MGGVRYRMLRGCAGPLRNAEPATDVTRPGLGPIDLGSGVPGREIFPEMPWKCGIFADFRALTGL